MKEKKTDDEKCKHEWGKHQYGHQCKICGRIMYASWSRPRHIIYKTTMDKVEYTEEDIFNVLEED